LKERLKNNGGGNLGPRHRSELCVMGGHSERPRQGYFTLKDQQQENRPMSAIGI